jgi:hypothetical protein
MHVLGLPSNDDVDLVASQLQAAGWALGGSAPLRSSNDKRSLVGSLASPDDTLAVAANANPGARIVIVCRPIGQFVANRLEAGGSIDDAVATARQYLRSALTLYRRNRKRSTFVYLGRSLHDLADQPRELVAAVERTRDHRADPLLEMLCARTLEADYQWREDIAELMASFPSEAIGADKGGAVANLAAARDVWNAWNTKLTEAEEETGLLRAQIRISRDEHAAIMSERSRNREQAETQNAALLHQIEEIALLRRQAQVSQEALQNLASIKQSNGAGISRKPKLAKSRLIESVDLTRFA